MVLCMVTTSFAATAAEQVVYAGDTWYYNAAGHKVEDTTFPGGAAVVKLSKTVEQAKTAGGDLKENEFEVTLQVSTTQKIDELKSDTPDAAAMLVLDVSNSMNYCGDCSAQSHNNSSNHETRLAKAKAAAKDFLAKFAATAEKDSGDKRYVAIVDYGSTAYTRLTWVDVATESGMKTAEAVIGSIQVAHGGLNNVSDNGATNIEAALMLAANVWENKDNQMKGDIPGIVKNLDYKYTILLTDGQPTYHVDQTYTSTTIITGDDTSGSSTAYNDAKDVGDQAERILSMKGVPKLYSICFGAGVWNTKPFSGFTQDQREDANPEITSSNMTVGEWLGAFSTSAFNGEGSANGLFDSFNSVIEQIKLAVQAWRVTDVMGDHVIYGNEIKQGNLKNTSGFDTAANTLTWNILASDHSGYTTQTVGGKEYSILTFTYKYKITLDNLDNLTTDGTPAYTSGATPANNDAKLTFAVKNEDTDLWQVVDPVPFPEPTVQGYTGELEFTKGWVDNGTFKTLDGVVFTLTSKDKSAEGNAWTATATSQNGGKVTFTGIPSGHAYTLTESKLTIDGKSFANPNGMDVNVAWQSTTFNKLNDQKQLINTLAEKEVTLVLAKQFGENSASPASIDFTVQLEGSNENAIKVTLPQNGQWKTTLEGLTPGTYVITEEADMEGYDLTKSVTLDGTPVSFGQYDNVRVPLTVAGESSTATYNVTFTNTYTQQVGKVSVEKTFWERDHQDLINNASNPKMNPLDESMFFAMEIDIVLTDAAGKAYTIELNADNKWKGGLSNLPVGVYTVTENHIGAVLPDHDFIHLHILVDGQEIGSDNKITIDKNSDIKLALENHYSHHLGHIRVTKLFEGIEDAAIPDGTVFYVDVYNTKVVNGEYVKDGNTAVTTITVEKYTGDGVTTWQGTSKDIPVGMYWLEELAPAAIAGYNFISGVFDAQQVVVTNSTPSARVTLTNTYEQQMGTLTVTKQFAWAKDGDKAGYVYPASITVNVLDGNASGNVVTTLTLTQDKDWTASVKLPLGNYYLSEVTAEGVAGTADVENYGVAATWDNPNVTINTDGQQVDRKVTNTYDKDYGTLTISKEFEGAPNTNTTITFVVYKQNADGTRGDVAASVILPADNGEWKKSVILPVGSYLLFEYGAHNAFTNYTLQNVTFNGTTWYEDGDVMTSVQGYAFEISRDGQTLPIAAKNTYEQDMAKLSIQKVFDGLTDTQKDNLSISVAIYNDDEQLVKTVTLNKGNSWKAENIELPVGAYTLVEDAKAAEVTGYNLASAWTDGATVTLAKGDAKTKTVTNTYEQQTGTLRLEKVINGVLTEDLPKLNNITVTVTITGNGETQTITLPDNSKWYKEGITLPVGTYTLSEAAVTLDGYTLTSAEFTGNGVTSGANGTATVVVTDGASIRVQLTNTFTRNTGTLMISKKFAQGSEQIKAAFVEKNKSIAVVVKHEDHVYGTVTLNADNEWSVTLENVPTGTYKVEEVTSENAANTAHVENYGLSVSYTSQGAVTVVQNETATMTVTNDYKQDVGRIKVHKDFGPDDDSQAAEAFIPNSGIAIEVYDEAGNLKAKGNVSRQNGGTVIFELPVGTYTLKEVTEEGAADTAYVDGYALSVTWDNADVAVTKDEEVLATVTNVYSRDKGSLKVTKSFVDCVLCGESARPVAITVELCQKQAAGNLSVVDRVELTASNAWSHTWTDLATGEYHVREVVESAQMQNHTLTASGVQKVVVVEGETADVSITNSYTHQQGKLTITKAFAEESALKAEDFAGKSINVMVNQGDKVYETVTLNAGNSWSVTLENVLVGTYTVEEVADTAHVENYGLSVSYTNQGAVTVTNSTTPAEMVVTNCYTQQTGKLTITKEFIGLPDDVRPAQIQFTVQKAGETTPRTVTLPVEQGGTKVWSVTLENLPIGEYTVTEVQDSAAVSGYSLTVPAAQTVTLTAEGAAAAITNSYTYIPVSGNLTITKAFANGSALNGSHFEQIDVFVMQGTAEYAKITLRKSENWTKTIEVPFGTYTVVEDAASASVPGYGLSVSYDKTEATVTTPAGDAVTITNHYTYIPVTGSLTLTKAFQGPQYLYPASVDFTVMGQGYSKRVTLSAENNWTITLYGLQPGEYAVTEHIQEGSGYSVAAHWSSANGRIHVAAGQLAVLNCTNVYQEHPTVSVRIPVEKTVVLAGPMDMAQTFHFSFQAAWQGSNVAVRFENDPSNTSGTFLQTSANTYGVTIKGEGTVKGFIVLEGYAEDLLNFKLQTWECLLGYATAEEAAAAGWTFDKTATDSAVVWNIQLGQDGLGGLLLSIARTDGQPVSQVSFLNAYTASFDPPETGDREDIVLWAVLCGVSAVCAACWIGYQRKNKAFQMK